ncbi:MAG: virulence protein RhuM/Fic/DOC family protein [Chlorobiaceae bacterium]|nr:virulence protein RhuM/Fic/DOC family protein [Chlorobiaceae bacterium]
MKNNTLLEKGELIIYTAPDGNILTEARLENETIWMSEQQIALVFERDRTVIGRHIKNIIKTGELAEKSNVQKMHIANSDKPVVFYNLDMILSVGYRVNSKRGTQFRIWANRILKEHLIQGYTINQKRLLEQQQRIEELKESIAMVERSLFEQVDTIDEARAIMQVLSDFARGLEILDDYDHETLPKEGNTRTPATVIEKQEFLIVVEAMRREFDSGVFGKPKDSSFESSVRQIYQSFDGNELYPTIEHKAAMLLYLVVKNHSFVDGNKRIAAALFLYFLEKNNILYRSKAGRIISADGLAALTLLIAISKPEEKDTMVQIVLSILNRKSS